MKLSPLRIKQTLDQLGEPAIVVPEAHPKAAQLHEIFGDHTFFLNADGLEIIEPAVPENNEAGAGDMGELVKLAMWDDAAKTVLAAHPAEATGVVIHFDPDLRKRAQAAQDD